MKLRYPTWWWGRWIEKRGGRWVTQDGNTFPSGQVSENEFEPYDEEKHGTHNEVERHAVALQLQQDPEVQSED